MKKYLIPFQLVIEKVPFLEYLFRMGRFVCWPFISDKRVQENDLRYALVDFVLSFTVFSVLVSFSVANGTGLSLKDIVSIFNFDWVVLSFVFYTAIPAIAVLLFYIFYFRNDVSGEVRFEKAYLLALHFVRVHSLIIVALLFVSAEMLLAYFNKGIPPLKLREHFVEQESSFYYGVAYFFVLLYVYGLSALLFIKKPGGIVKFGKAFLTVFGVYAISFSFNSFVPIGATEYAIDAGNLCEVTKKSKFYLDLSAEHKAQVEAGVCSLN